MVHTELVGLRPVPVTLNVFRTPFFEMFILAPRPAIESEERFLPRFQ